jgi:uncharacterized DUF497 family protein
MKSFDWNSEKNEWLRQIRKITFEEILYHIQAGDLLDILVNESSSRYSNQRVFVVKIDNYVYLVPYVESDEMIFLKTIIPSRKMTRRYLGAQSHETD